MPEPSTIVIDNPKHSWDPQRYVFCIPEMGRGFNQFHDGRYAVNGGYVRRVLMKEYTALESYMLQSYILQYIPYIFELALRHLRKRHALIVASSTKNENV